MRKLAGPAIVAVAVALFLGLGSFFNSRENADKTPCERYAKVVSQALDNCHSGVNRSHRYHIGVCKKLKVNVTDACLDAIRKLSKSNECEALEAGPATSVGEVCFSR